MTAALALQLRALYDRAPSAFGPAGPQAARLASLGWTMIAIATVVFVIVMGVLLVPLWRRRGAPAVDGPPAPVNERAWVLYGGTAIPAIILAGVFALTLGAYRASLPDGGTALTIEVIGHQWWWEVRYPATSIVTADEIHLPVGRPVRVILRSADVIHSFWVPNLAGKTDAIPGVTNAAWLQADAPGTWRGACAEYCGMQHAHMALSVVAQTPDEFARWMARERTLAPAAVEPVAREGQRAFLSAQCVYCHTVRGTQAGGRAGPDLTHIGSRLTLAGGTVANTSDNLARWILAPERIKPDTKMPAVPLTGGQLHAIVTYLESLK